MTLLSRVLAYFPTLMLLLIAIGLVVLVLHPHPLVLGAIALIIYGVPLLAYHLHQWRFPLKLGITYLQGNTYSPWWGSHQIQLIYITFPALEALLRLIPGAFSLWLRLWGANIGRQVYWTPGLEIADRGLLEVGDRVVFGHRVGLYAHIIKPRRQDLMLYLKPIKIGSDVFIGAGSHLGPGTAIPAGSYLPVDSRLYPNQVFEPNYEPNYEPNGEPNGGNSKFKN